MNPERLSDVEHVRKRPGMYIGGTHEDAFREALAKVGWQPAVALIHVVMQEPRYAGPTRTLLKVPDKKEAMYSALLSSLEEYLDSNASESS